MTDLVQKIREALGNKDVEWSSGPYRNKCPWCDGLYPTHREDCKRQETLTPYEPHRDCLDEDGDCILGHINCPKKEAEDE